MIIEEIKLHNFRNYEQLTLTPHPGTNVLFGPNGSGKTNLLEAVHYCALGRSHRTGADREVVRREMPMGACGVRLHRADGRYEIAVKLTPEGQRKKQVFINQKKAPRLSELMGRLQCVIFSPEDLLLIKEGPVFRRRFVDMLISQVDPAYFTALQLYQRALEQRNALLREEKCSGRMDTVLLDAYEDELARQTAVILPVRRRMIGALRRLSAEQYSAISGKTDERLEVRYQCCIGTAAMSLDEMQAYARKALRERRREDLIRGGTGFGPHREDLALLLEGREMRQFASQGQMRTAALSLKLSQLALFREHTGENPILLLDDVMSELDLTRRTRLLQEIDGIQTFVTCTDESDLMGCRDFRSCHVIAENGAARVVKTGEWGEAEAPAEAEEDPVFD